MTDEIIKYAWLDEDGEQVSPLHAKFGSALNFINGWWDRYNRQRERRPDFDLTDKHSFMGYQAMSKSGKPPVKLVRMVVRTVEEPLTIHEQVVVDSMIAQEAGPDYDDVAEA